MKRKKRISSAAEAQGQKGPPQSSGKAGITRPGALRAFQLWQRFVRRECADLTSGAMPPAGGASRSTQGVQHGARRIVDLGWIFQLGRVPRSLERSSCAQERRRGCEEIRRTEAVGRRKAVGWRKEERQSRLEDRRQEIAAKSAGKAGRSAATLIRRPVEKAVGKEEGRSEIVSAGPEAVEDSLPPSLHSKRGYSHSNRALP